MRVYVPCDSSALSVGADAVARAIAQQRPDVTVIRNGSRGMFWLEPLVEVETPRGRMAYGPVTADAVAGLIGGFNRSEKSPLRKSGAGHQAVETASCVCRRSS